MIITLEDYLMGRDKTYSKEWTDANHQNALQWLRRINLFLALLPFDLSRSPITKTYLSSGWRPKAYNDELRIEAIECNKRLGKNDKKKAIPASNSRHISCQAGDLYDPQNKLDDWLMQHQSVLIACDLYLEHPSNTPDWSHLQIVPPASKKRVFLP